MSKKALVTGSGGFIGKNLVTTLRQDGYKVFEFDRDNTDTELKKYIAEADIVFHIAGINRPKDPKEFIEGNVGLTEKVVNLLSKKSTPIIFTSSIQADLDNDYGKSKKAAEDYIKKNCKNAKIYRLPNVFGKWSKPNYNGVIATFCYNISRGLPIQINNPNTQLTITYIDDVVKTLVYNVELVTHTITLGGLAGKITNYKNNIDVPPQEELDKKLYATYLSYLPEDGFSWQPKMNIDERGSFTELLHLGNHGQISVNTAKKGVTKGNHWHHTKNEKFIVVSGQGVIRFRKIGEKEVIEYPVGGDKVEIVDIPPGYTHNITNTGKTDLVFVIWANELFNPEAPDTFFEEV